MGASIIRGKDLVLQASRYFDGSEFEELVPVEGAYEGAAYSSVDAAVQVCQEHGIPRELWPLYYGFDHAEVPLDEVRQRCECLRLALAALPAGELNRHWWLRVVAGWLAGNEIFCVLE